MMIQTQRYFDIIIILSNFYIFFIYISNDHDALTDSCFHEIMEEIQQQWFEERADGGRKFSWLGDGVFTNMKDVNTCIRTYHHVTPNAPLEEKEFLETCRIKGVREYVEHSYAALENIMGITTDPKRWYFVASKPYVVDMYISYVSVYINKIYI